MPLVTTANLSAPDDFYEALLEAHQGLSIEESHAFNARLILVLANQVGDLESLREALRVARRGGEQDRGPAQDLAPGRR